MYKPEDNIYALATAYQKSALAIFRISGEGIFEKIKNVFSNKEFFKDGGNRIYHGFINNKDGKTIDEVMIAKFISPRSYTGENMAEITCHGSLIVIKEIALLLEELDIRQAQKGEFSFRAFINGKMDLSHAEAIHDLIDSYSSFEKDNATANMMGDMHMKVEEIKKSLLALVAALTVQIDYDDSEIGEIEFDCKKAENIVKELNAMVHNYLVKKAYKKGIDIAIIGLSNSGKSSLFNALLNEDRSIVSNTPGTTRDYIKETIEYKKMLINIFDTAGFRDDVTNSLIEDEGIKKSISLIEKAEFLIYLVDGRVGISETDKEWIKRLNNKKYVIIFNKGDLLDEHTKNKYRADDIIISVKERSGVKKILDKIEEQYPKLSEGSNVVPSSERQERLFRRCKEHVSRAIDYKNEGVELEFILSEMNQALKCLGEITGEVTSENVLEEIFSTFCLGK